MSLAFACPGCSKRFTVKAEMAGKAVKCPCGKSFRVPTPKVSQAKKPVAATAAQQKPRKRPVDDYEIPTSTGGKRCPSCKEPIGLSAVLCVKCGFQLTTGKKLTTSTEAEVKKTKKKSSKRKASVGLSMGGSLLRGTLFSLIGAGLGGIVWAMVAVFTGMTIGWLAWALGGAAGIGMALGHEDKDGTVAGIIAAVCSLAGLFGAKAYIFFFVMMPILSIVNNADLIAAEFSVTMLPDYFISKELERKRIDPDEATESQRNEASKRAEDRLRKMSEPQKQVAVEEMKKEFRQIINEARNDADMDASLLNPTFFGTMFSPIDGLFILLAVGTAYRLGSGQES